MNEWQPIEDGIPDEGVLVLITQYKYLTPKLGRYVMLAVRHGDKWYIEDDESGMYSLDDRKTYPPTHWQEIPELPK